MLAAGLQAMAPLESTSTGPDAGEPSGGVQPTRRRRHRGYAKSGFYALKATLKQLGPRVIDKRTGIGKALARWRDDLIADLGGDPSTAQRQLIELATRTKLLLDSVDAWLLTQPSLVNARRKALLPVVRERQQLADSLAKYLAQLGLERRARPVPSLADYLGANGNGV
jgi:hypothetical protein